MKVLQNEKHCPVCGRLFFVTAQWGYKSKDRCVCSWSCLRREEKREEEMFEQKFGEKAVTLFGEGYGGKIQGGGNYRKDPDFIMFDVLIDGLYLKREAVCDIAAAFGVDVVPVALTGTIEDGIEYVKATEKCGICEAVLEGLVSRPACELLDRLGNRVIVKIKKRDY